MTMPERFSPDYDLVDVMDKHPYGAWVKFDDYANLSDLAEELARALKEIRDETGNLPHGAKLALARYHAAITP